MRMWLSRLRALFRAGHRLDRELDEEIRIHLELAAADNRARGMDPDEAWHAARRSFGAVEPMKERYRDQRSLPFAESLMQDVRYALRIFRRSPAFTATAVLSLALGIGANTAIFSVFDAVLLKALPVKEPGQLFALQGGDFSYAAYQVFRQYNEPFSDLFATSGITSVDAQIDNGASEQTRVSLVSGSYFSVLGVSALIGRTFAADEDRVPGAHPIAVMGYGYWERRFGRDPRVLGTTIRLSGTPVTIIGVTPPAFFGEQVGAEPNLWVPLTMWARVVPGRDLVASRTTAWLQIIGRLKPGRDTSQAGTTLTAQYKQVLTEVFGDDAAEDTRREIAGAHVTLQSAHNGVSRLRRQFSRPLQVLMSVVALVLLVACANVANLVIARATARRREIALRLALGISRPRLVRQLLTESLLLSAAGGAAGLVFAAWGRESLLRLVTVDGSRVPLAVATDARLLAFVAAISIVTGIVFGLAPAWQSVRVNLSETMGRAGHAGVRRRRLPAGSLLVVAEIAMSLVLLMGAGLFLRTLSNLHDVDLGFAPERLLIVDVNPRAANYRDDAYSAVCRRLLERLNAVPGVATATFSENGVLSGRDSDTNRIRPDGYVPVDDGLPTVRFDVVGPGYFTTMGIPLLAGRDIDAHDDATARGVIVINDAMARRFFGAANPIGRRMLWGEGDDAKALEVVGVVPHVKQHGPRDEVAPRFYLPYFQHGQPELASARFIMRTAANPSAVATLARSAIQSEDKTLPILGVDTAVSLEERTVVQERMIAMLSSGFTVLALALACIGVYGLMAYRVVQRTSEIGIRMALGAERSRVVWSVLRQDLVLIAAGLAIGAPLAIAASSLIQSLLFGVDGADRGTLVAAVIVMTLIGLVAGLGPALRASRIEPAVSLRHE
jgi:predicted permease